MAKEKSTFEDRLKKYDFLSQLPYVLNGRFETKDTGQADKPLKHIFKGRIIETNEDLIEVVVEGSIDRQNGMSLIEIGSRLANFLPPACGSTKSSTWCFPVNFTPESESIDGYKGQLGIAGVTDPDEWRQGKRNWELWRKLVISDCCEITVRYLKEKYGEVRKDEKTGEPLSFERELGFQRSSEEAIDLQVIRRAPVKF